jgi:uncharacterized protein (TIGR01777 family)
LHFTTFWTAERKRRIYDPFDRPRKSINPSEQDREYMRILLTGSSGLVGSTLVEYFFTKGYSIQCLKRNKTPASPHFWATDALHPAKGFHSVIHLAGENVTEGRWTEQKKQTILMSRLEGTKQLIDYIAGLQEKPTTFFCASAVGYYGHRGDEILDEHSASGKGFLADVCRQWEQETKRLWSMNIRTVNLRFGMILSSRGGALQKMIPPFKARRGGVIGSGKQYISWISLKDLVQIVDFLIENKRIKGPVNVVCSTPATNRELTRALGKALNRPIPFKMPGFMAQLIFGQMAEEMLLSSSRVIPKILMESGYEFSDHSLEEVVVRCCLDNTAAQP